MGQYGRMTSLDDLPSDKILVEQVKEAARLNADGVKVAKSRSKSEKAPADSVLLWAGTEEESQSPGDIRESQPQPQARIHRVDHRSQDNRHARKTHRDDTGMARRRQEPELEV